MDIEKSRLENLNENDYIILDKKYIVEDVSILNQPYSRKWPLKTKTWTIPKEETEFEIVVTRTILNWDSTDDMNTLNDLIINTITGTELNM